MGELRFHAATLDDAAFAADVWTAARPSAPVDPVVKRYWWATPSETYVSERYVVTRGGERIGFALVDHVRWDGPGPRYVSLRGDLLPELRTAARLDELLAGLEVKGRATGATVLRTKAVEDDPLRESVVRGRGYREDRRSRRWELDLVGNRARILALAEESRERMRRAGIELCTLAAIADPSKYEQVWRVGDEAARDIPTTEPHPDESLEDYLQWLRSPDTREDRFWVARREGRIVGLSVLSYPPVRGIVNTSYTATARSVRGLGVARATKGETLVQAIGLGVDRVRTGNDAQNAPILHINAAMGYRPIAGAIEFMKDAG